MSQVSKIKRSIVKIQGVNRSFNWTQPYLIEHEYESGGTAFFVDPVLFGEAFPVKPNSRYLLTNFHVCQNYITPYAILEWPERNKSYLTAEVIFVAPNLDVAILELNMNLPQTKWRVGDYVEWVSSIKNLKVDVKNIHKGNSQPIRCVGFPNLQGDYQISDGSLSSRGLGMLSCDLSLNSGNSGGPLFLKKTQSVIGICTATVAESERISLAVPMQEIFRFFQYYTDYSTTILRLPCFGVSLRKLTVDYMEYKGIDQAFTGGLVKDVIKNQACDLAKLKKGDIIMGLETKDPQGKIVKFKVDPHGQVQFCSTDKRVKIDTMEFLLNLDPNYLKIHYFRKGKIHETDVVLRPIDFQVRARYPHYEKIDWCVFGGMTFLNLSLNMLDPTVDEDSDGEDDAAAYDHSLLHTLKTTKGMENIVICTNITPQSYPVYASDITENEQIIKVNKTKIKCVKHLGEVLDNVAKDYYSGKSEFVIFHTTNNTHYFSLEKLSEQEREDNEKVPYNIVLRLLKKRNRRKRKFAQ